MYTFITVDDEAYVHQGLDALMDWQGMGFERVGLAQNGSEGLAIIEALRPDVIITDIRMPVADGLQMIERVGDIDGYTPEFVLVSGYSEFEYAKQAMQYGVRHYLLKPIDEDELADILLTIKGELEQAGLTERRVSVQRNAARAAILRRLAKRKPSDALMSTSRLVFADALDGPVRMYQVVLPSALNEDQDEIAYIEDACVSVIGGADHLKAFEESEATVCVAVAERALAIQGMTPLVFARALQRKVGEAYKGKPMVLIGSLSDGIGNLYESLQSTGFARAYAYFHSSGGIVAFDDIRGSEFDTALASVTSYPELIRAVEENDQAAMEVCLDNIMTGFATKTPAPQVLRAWLNSLAIDVLRLVLDLGGRPSQALSDFYAFSLNPGFPGVSQMKGKVLEFCRESASLISALQRTNRTGIVPKMLSEIRSSYSQDLSIRKIAEDFGMNPAYIGRLFSKTTGMSFRDALRAKRVEEAARLLRNSSLLVYEIAEMVGYKDEEYFVRQFERVIGATPAAYRRKNS